MFGTRYSQPDLLPKALCDLAAYVIGTVSTLLVFDSFIPATVVDPWPIEIIHSLRHYVLNPIRRSSLHIIVLNILQFH